MYPKRQIINNSTASSSRGNERNESEELDATADRSTRNCVVEEDHNDSYNMRSKCDIRIRYFVISDGATRDCKLVSKQLSCVAKVIIRGGRTLSVVKNSITSHNTVWYYLHTIMICDIIISSVFVTFKMIKLCFIFVVPGRAS